MAVIVNPMVTGRPCAPRTLGPNHHLEAQNAPLMACVCGQPTRHVAAMGGPWHSHHMRSGWWWAMVAGLGGCPVTFPDTFSDNGLPVGVFGEVNATRTLTVSLASPVTTQRFVVPVLIDPPSPDARVEAFFVRVEGLVVADLATNAFASSMPAGWALVEQGTALRTFSAADATTEAFRLSLAHASDAGWTTTDDSAAAQIELVVSAPSDVDFDGVDDDVTVSIGELSPVILGASTAAACTECSCGALGCIEGRCAACEVDTDCCADRRCVDGACLVASD
jgi:hypothetical protein